MYHLHNEAVKLHFSSWTDSTRMAQPLPKTIAQELSTLLKEYGQSVNLTEFRKAQIGRDFLAGNAKLERVDHKSALTLYSYWYALEGDAERCWEYFQTKEKMYPLLAEDWSKQGDALDLLGISFDSLECARKAVEQDPLNLLYRKDYFVRLMMAGRFHEMYTATESAMKAGMKDSLIQLNELDDYLSFLKDNDVSEAQLEQLFRVAEQVTQAHRVGLTKAQTRLVSDGGEEWLSCRYTVEADIDTAVDMNFELADKIAMSGIPSHVTRSIVLQYD